MAATHREKRSTQVRLDEKLTSLLEWMHALYRLAVETGRGMWENALELPRLRKRGATDAVLQTLLEGGLIEHLVETTRRGASGARFARRRGRLGRSVRASF